MFYQGALFDVGWITGPALPYVGFAIALLLMTLLVGAVLESNDTDSGELIVLDVPQSGGDAVQDLRKAA